MRDRRRFEAELVDLEVFRPDTRDRVPIDDTLAVPYRWICRLTVPSMVPTERGYGMGTGVLIGPRHVLTAAHVLVSIEDPRRTVGNRLRVQPARNGHDHPFEPIGVRAWRVNPHWAVRRGGAWILQPQHDYGLVTLKDDVSAWRDGRLGACALGHWGMTGRCGAGARIGLAPADIVGQDAHVTGYPSDKPEATLWTGSGPITWDRRRHLLLHTIDTKPGQSGSPVWVRRNGHCCLAGVHSGAGGAWRVDSGGNTTLTHNAAALVSPDVLRELRRWMQPSGRT